MTVQELIRYIDFALRAHSEHAKNPRKAVRLFDGTTPYAVHPIACAMSILQEPLLLGGERSIGAKTLILHDVVEDTTIGLPSWVEPQVRHHVGEMTFASSDEEMRLVWDRSEFIRLLKLFDKESNLRDGTWMKPEKRARYEEYTLRLAVDVEKTYGDLNIIRSARAICAGQGGVQ